MSFYRTAGWKFWVLLFVEYSLVFYGARYDNTCILMSGLILGVLLIPYSAHVFIKDNVKGK